VLSRKGRFTVQTHPGATFFRQREAAAALGSVLSDFASMRPVDVVVRSANGSFVDRAEATALENWMPNIAALFPKRSFGEAPGASALLQMITAVLALEKGKSRRALISVIGFNHQANAAVVERVD
jgi:3-oxoacyl-(acyl-carrier-protein) synthase